MSTATPDVESEISSSTEKIELLRVAYEKLAVALGESTEAVICIADAGLTDQERAALARNFVEHCS